MTNKEAMELATKLINNHKLSYISVDAQKYIRRDCINRMYFYISTKDQWAKEIIGI